MNFRDRIIPYTTLQIKKNVLIITRVHVGTKIFIRWLGHSCVPVSIVS
jgi:hypothetical protein